MNIKRILYIFFIYNIYNRTKIPIELRFTFFFFFFPYPPCTKEYLPRMSKMNSIKSASIWNSFEMKLLHNFLRISKEAIKCRCPFSAAWLAFYRSTYSQYRLN